MINRKKIPLIIFLCLIGSLLLNSFPAHAELVDTIAAVVEEDVILESELQTEINTVLKRMEGNGGNMPPESLLRKQVLEKMILDSLQLQLAQRAGINVNQEMVNAQAAEIAQKNNISPEQFREELEKSGIPYKNFLKELSNQIAIGEFRSREITRHIQVTDREVEHYLETHEKPGDESVQYHLAHILITIKENATGDEIQNQQKLAEELVKKLRAGGDFAQAAASYSNDPTALTGGDLGWRSIDAIPSQLVDSIKILKINEVTDPVKSPGGFHIIKLLDTKTQNSHIVTVTNVRHILIKPNEIVDDAEAQKRLFALKARIADGDDFAALARSHSDDKASTLKGGSLGWIAPGNLVKPFEEAMDKLPINEVSEPIQTQFGWHLIQVLGRKDKDTSSEHQKNQIIEIIRKRKFEEETELWLRKLRDEAYVEIHNGGH